MFDKFKAAVHGDVDGGDVARLLAAATPLGELRQAYDDQRLGAQIQHPDDEWTVREELGHIAAPLWLSDGLIGVAQSLTEVEAECHPHSSLMSAASHNVALVALSPLETLLVEVSAALANPHRSSSLRLPLLVDLRNSLRSGVSSASCVRGLIRGAERVEGDVQLALAGLQTLVDGGESPGWAKSALQRLAGDAAAAGTRLQILRARTAPLLVRETLDPRTLAEASIQLLISIEIYLTLGQLASAPLALPEAPARVSTPPVPPRVSTRPDPEFRVAPPIAAEPPRETREPPRATPQINPGRASRDDLPSPPARRETGRAMPDIGGPAAAPIPDSPGANPDHVPPQVMPDVGGSSPARSPKPFPDIAPPRPKQVASNDKDPPAAEEADKPPRSSMPDIPGLDRDQG